MPRTTLQSRWDHTAITCDLCGKKYWPSKIEEHRRAKHGAPGADPGPQGDSPFAGEAPSQNGAAVEPAGKPTLRERARKVFGGGEKADRPPKAEKEKRPRRPIGMKDRVSTADIFGFGFELGGEVMGGTPLQATAGMLKLQAPIAGHVIDEAIAGTVLDRIILQPVAKAESRVEAVGSVIGPPLIVFQMERYYLAGEDAKANAMIPLLKMALRTGAPYIAEGLKKAKAREADLRETMRELYPTLPEGEATPVDLIIAEIFAPTARVREEYARRAAQTEDQPSAAESEPVEV